MLELLSARGAGTKLAPALLLFVVVFALVLLVEEHAAQLPKRISELDAFNKNICGRTKVGSRRRSGRHHGSGDNRYRHGHAGSSSKKRAHVGWLAKPGQVPWHTGLEWRYERKNFKGIHLKGGATFIHNNIILTSQSASHVVNVDGDKKTRKYIRAGQTNRNEKLTADVQRIEIKKRCQLTGEYFVNIVVAELAEPVKYNDYIQPACMYDLDSDKEPDTVKEGHECFTAGLGEETDYVNGQQSDGPATSNLTVLPTRPCTDAERKTHRYEMLAADCYISNDHAKYHGAMCEDDTGTGMYCRNPADNLVYVMGTYDSFSHGCRSPQPMMFTDLHQHRAAMKEALVKCLGISAD